MTAWPNHCPAGLRTLDLANNSLPHLPSALARATNLERLRLSDNRQLAVTATGVDATLARLPRLAVLELQRSGTEEAALDVLKRDLPHLSIVTDASRGADPVWSQGAPSAVLNEEPFGL